MDGGAGYAHIEIRRDIHPMVDTRLQRSSCGANRKSGIICTLNLSIHHTPIYQTVCKQQETACYTTLIQVLYDRAYACHPILASTERTSLLPSSTTSHSTHPALIPIRQPLDRARRALRFLPPQCKREMVFLRIFFLPALSVSPLHRIKNLIKTYGSFHAT